MAAWITIFLVIIVFINIWPVKLYGEVEFWFSFLKCLALVAIIFFMIVMTSGGIPATHGPIEFRYWKDPGAFVNGIRGIAAAFVQAGFSFGGGKWFAPAPTQTFTDWVKASTLRLWPEKPKILARL